MSCHSESVDFVMDCCVNFCVGFLGAFVPCNRRTGNPQRNPQQNSRQNPCKKIQACSEKRRQKIQSAARGARPRPPPDNRFHNENTCQALFFILLDGFVTPKSLGKKDVFKKFPENNVFCKRHCFRILCLDDASWPIWLFSKAARRREGMIHTFG